VGPEEKALSLLHIHVPDHRLDPIGQNHDLFPIGGTDVPDFGHLRSCFPK
jgi:hypothetical protein